MESLEGSEFGINDTIPHVITGELIGQEQALLPEDLSYLDIFVVNILNDSSIITDIPEMFRVKIQSVLPLLPITSIV